MVVETLDSIEADISVLCTQGNAPQLINTTNLHRHMQFSHLLT